MPWGYAGPVLLTVGQFAVAIGVFLVLEAVVPASAQWRDLFIFASVVFGVTALTWAYWNATGGGWGISRSEYERRKEELEAEDASDDSEDEQ